MTKKTTRNGNELNIAQALKRIAKIKGHMGDLTKQAVASVSHLESKQPTFGFKETCQEIDETRERLLTLQAAVAIANATSYIQLDGKRMLLAEAVRRKDELQGEIDWLKKLPIREDTEQVPEDAWSEASGRYIRQNREIKYVSALSEKERVLRIRGLEDRYEILNTAIDLANGQTTVKWSEPVPPPS